MRRYKLDSIALVLSLILAQVSFGAPTVSKVNGEIENLGLAASVGSSALTISLKTKLGNNASSGDPVYISFRSATSTSGVFVRRAVTGSLSVVISNGSTLGLSSAVPQYVWVYALDNAGTVELAVSGVKLFDDTSIQSTTAEGGSGGADTGNILYSTTARSNVAIRLIGRVTATEATAGVWATSPSEVSLISNKSSTFVYARYYQTSNTAQSGYFDCPTKDIDTHNAVTTGSGTFNFAAPIAGVYSFCVYYSGAVNADMTLEINGAVPTGAQILRGNPSNGIDSGCISYPLDVGGAAKMKISSNAVAIGSISIALVGRR